MQILPKGCSYKVSTSFGCHQLAQQVRTCFDTGFDAGATNQQAGDIAEEIGKTAMHSRSSDQVLHAKQKVHWMKNSGQSSYTWNSTR